MLFPLKKEVVPVKVIIVQPKHKDTYYFLNIIIKKLNLIGDYDIPKIAKNQAFSMIFN